MTAPFTDYMDFVSSPHEAWDEMQALYAKLAAAEAITARAVRLALERAAAPFDAAADKWDNKAARFRPGSGPRLDCEHEARFCLEAATAIRAMATDEAVDAIIKEASE